MLSTAVYDEFVGDGNENDDENKTEKKKYRR